MKQANCKDSQQIKCAIYTRKSSEEGLEQSFNSLDAQREACEAYIKSQRHEGWVLTPTAYDDGGFSGGTLERPALARLIENIKQGTIDIVVVYKVDRLSRSLADFVRLVELFDKYGMSFVSVTQQFNTSTSMGRLTLNVLLSFAQFEREVTGERIRDKIAASKQKGMWMGGVVPLGYDVQDKLLVTNEEETKTVQHIYTRYLKLRCVRKLKAELDSAGYVSKIRKTENGSSGGKSFSRGALYTLLKNPVYIGKIAHKGAHHDGQHTAIVAAELWEQVQKTLAENRHQKVRKTLAKNPALLAGLLFDDRNNPMSPTHTTKNNRRYRYYISQAVLQFQESDAGSVIRTPAQPLEDVITYQVRQLLGISHNLLGALSPRNLPATKLKRLISKARALSKHWDSLQTSQQIDLIRTLIHKISISKNEISITFSRTAIIETLMENAQYVVENESPPPDNYLVTIPAHLKRSGLETRLVIPGEVEARAHDKTILAVQKALGKALTWNQALITGAASSMTQLAKQDGVTQQYVAQITKLAFLAPDIMKAINYGDVPTAISLGVLKKGFPLDWDQQRKVFGFTL